VDSVALTGFLDELGKIAAAHGLTSISKSRTGVRPISVDNLVKKHNDGSLFKKKHADSQGNPQDVRGSGSDDPGAARLPRRPGQVPTTDPANVPMQTKLGMYRLTDSTLPVTWGEDMRAGNSKPRQPGQIPTQNNMNAAEPDGRIEPPAGRMHPTVVTNDESAKKPKKGNTPTSGRDNVVDRYDQRDNATTVTGLAQHSTNIGATNQPAEHT
jgi:hypothetical protein